MRAWWKRMAGGLGLGMLLLAVLVSQAGAQQVGVGWIQGAPLKIQMNRDGSMQVWHSRYTHSATYGTAGSGFFIVSNKKAFGSRFNRMEFVGQEPTTGDGSRGSPFRSVLQLRLNTGVTTLGVTQTVLYVNNNQGFQMQWQIANTGSADACLAAYHAADLYFANDDYGIGYYNAGTGSVGGYNRAKDWFMVFTPVTRADHYEESGYGTIWNRVGAQQTLLDSINPSYIDNGAALQWNLCLSAGQSKTVSDVWSFGESEGAIVAAAQQASGAASAGPLGLGAARFRPAEPGAPALTTSIPTPLDLSLTPEVVGANLLWAALVTLLFVAASELFNRVLVEYEELFRRWLRPLGAARAWGKRAGLAERLGRPLWYERLKLALIVLLYGLIFSFLDDTWEPFSLNGVWLFISMALAFGVVGLSDDMIQWRTARRWQLPTRISLRPGNLALALGSLFFSRSLVLAPGVMFGTPEAFEVDQAALDERRRNRLLLLGGGVLLAIALGAWLPTILSALGLQAARGLPEGARALVSVPLSALQSLLLLIFAVAVQNLFLHMLALPESIGAMIKRWNRVAWFFGLLLAAYVYLQTLLNPAGNLQSSLETSNIRVLLGLALLFLLFALVSRPLLQRLSSRNQPQPTPAVMASGYAYPAPYPPGGPVEPVGPAPAGWYGVPVSPPPPAPTPPPAPAAPAEDLVLPEAGPEFPPLQVPSALHQDAIRTAPMPAPGQLPPAAPPPGEPVVSAAPNLSNDVQRLLVGWAAASHSERQAHLMTVAQHGRPAVELLLGSLSSPDPVIRLAAVGAVGSLGDRSCLLAVQVLLNDRDPGVAQIARWAAEILQTR